MVDLDFTFLGFRHFVCCASEAISWPTFTYNICAQPPLYCQSDHQGYIEVGPCCWIWAYVKCYVRVRTTSRLYTLQYPWCRVRYSQLQWRFLMTLPMCTTKSSHVIASDALRFELVFLLSFYTVKSMCVTWSRPTWTMKSKICMLILDFYVILKFWPFALRNAISVWLYAWNEKAVSTK